MFHPTLIDTRTLIATHVAGLLWKTTVTCKEGNLHAYCPLMGQVFGRQLS